jgi:hypothetical protein
MMRTIPASCEPSDGSDSSEAGAREAQELAGLESVHEPRTDGMTVEFRRPDFDACPTLA